MLRRFLPVVILLLLCACDSIYDEREAEPLTDGHHFRNIDASRYTHWVYVNLQKGDTTSVSVSNDLPPEDWDIAFHRYDIKTRSGAGMETPYLSLDELKQAVDEGTFVRPAADDWVRDVEDSIVVDMSHMMDGYLVYAPSHRNPALSHWVNVDMRSMPPLYTMSEQVYLVLLADSSCVAIRFTGFTNPNAYGAKGYVSFDVEGISW